MTIERKAGGGAGERGGRAARVAGVAALLAVAAASARCSSSSSKGDNTGGTVGGTGGSGHGGSGHGGSGHGGSVTTTTVTTTTTGTGGSGGAAPQTGASVLQHHKNPSRDGHTVDPALTREAAKKKLHLDPAFHAVTSGAAYAQPLFVDGGAAGGDRLFVATEDNHVYALDAATGAARWAKRLAPSVKLSDLECGNIDPLGITGTPIIDLPSRTLFVDAMTTPDGGATKKHLVYALSIDDGSTRPGFPVDVGATATANGGAFDSAHQNERGALALLGGVLYVPYGGHYGDCGAYHGWVVGIPVDHPTNVKAWATRALEGGAWASGGIASDGTSLFVATGNTNTPAQWSDGEAIIRLAPGPTFSLQPADYFAPPDWMNLDAGDVDIGGSGPVLVDVPGATPSKLVVSLGKNGFVYLLDRSNLGGINKGVAQAQVASNEIINAAAAYTTAQATYVVFKGQGQSCPNGTSGELTAIKIGASSPPTITTAWCGAENGAGSPMVTTIDGTHEAIVWGLGSEGDNRLHGLDGDTGAVVFDGGMGPAMNGLARFATPIAAKGRIYVAGDGAVYAFTTK